VKGGFCNFAFSDWILTLVVPSSKLLQQAPSGSGGQGRNYRGGHCHHEVGGARWTQPNVTADGR